VPKDTRTLRERGRFKGILCREALRLRAEPGDGVFGGCSMRTAHHTSMLWHVSFEGEGGIDQGGLFRESLTEMSKELHGPLLGLFVECPNNRRATGSNMDK
jgi:hypothetical protein